MDSVPFKIFKRFSFLTAFIFAITGCGSSGSSSSTTNNGTGSIAAKLIWNSPEAKTTAKTLYAFPADVTSIKISVYKDTSSTNTDNLITSQIFDPSLGSGTITGIPAGNGRAIKVEGSGAHGSQTGVLIYLGTATVDITVGQTESVTIAMEAPVTSASPASAPSAASFPVTLTTSVPATIYYGTSEPATIYYTTNSDPVTTSSPNAPSPVSVSVTPPVTLKFFAVVRGLYEAVTEKTY